ncbi:hypothetical protein H2248_011373 [Termitomyces sp. 'cryptogamus']|nr:hypothetical protein H2248_011373 [Termitomyces sp. 'cryptogamus']
MSLEDPGAASLAGIGGLGDQVRELREIIELPLPVRGTVCSAGSVEELPKEVSCY